VMGKDVDQPRSLAKSVTVEWSGRDFGLYRRRAGGGVVSSGRAC